MDENEFKKHCPKMFAAMQNERKTAFAYGIAVSERVKMQLMFREKETENKLMVFEIRKKEYRMFIELHNN